MSPAEVRRRVEAIREIAYDAEVAHSTEDEIHGDVLAAIAAGAPDAAALATEALRTYEIGFSRWYA